jgi:hypothetical protein
MASYRMKSTFWHVYVLALAFDVTPGDIDRYWYMYRASRDAVRSFSKRYPSYALRKHVWGRIVEG